MDEQIYERYAAALFDVVAPEGKDEGVYETLEALKPALLENPSFVDLMDTPTLSAEEKAKILDGMFAGKVDAYLLNFLKLLAQKRRFAALDGMIDHFKAKYFEAHDLEEAVVTTAVPMKDAQKAALTAKLCQKTGKTIRLTEKVDPAILGGVLLELGHVQMDATVKGKLKQLGQKLRDTSLITKESW